MTGKERGEEKKKRTEGGEEKGWEGREGRGREEGQILILQKLKLALSEENPEHV